MKLIAICFLALLVVAFARSVIDDVDYVKGDSGFDGNNPSFDDEIKDIDDRIVGGEETTIEQYPYTISMRLGRDHVKWCGGSIISPIRGLSSAHCLFTYPRSEYFIRAGSSKASGDGNVQIRKLSKFIYHERFQKPYRANDIALLFWEEPLIFSAKVRPIRLPTANATILYGEKSTLVGWGYIRDGGPSSEVLKVVTLPLMSNKDCNYVYPESVTPDMVCSGGEEGRGGCDGDSGGPLVHNNTLIGIASWTRKCALKGFPTVFARVAFFIDWINEHID